MVLNEEQFCNWIECFVNQIVFCCTEAEVCVGWIIMCWFLVYMIFIGQRL